MADTDALEGLDPYDLLDAEAARIDAYASNLDDEALARQSGCAEWTVRDLLGHLAAVEDYHHACLDDTLGALFERMMAQGVTGLDGFNDVGVRSRADRSAGEVLEEWRTADAETRRRMRARDGGDMATSVGPYPVRLQAFHVASELATHADDLHVPETAAESADRVAWRSRFSRFALTETKPETRVEVVPGGVRVTVDGETTEVDDATFVQAVAGRLPADAPVDEVWRARLSTMPS